MGVLRKIRVDPNSWALKHIFIVSFAQICSCNLSVSINLYMSCKFVLDLARFLKCIRTSQQTIG